MTREPLWEACKKVFASSETGPAVRSWCRGHIETLGCFCFLVVITDRIFHVFFYVEKLLYKTKYTLYFIIIIIFLNFFSDIYLIIKNNVFVNYSFVTFCFNLNVFHLILIAKFHCRFPVYYFVKNLVYDLFPFLFLLNTYKLEILLFCQNYKYLTNFLIFH